MKILTGTQIKSADKFTINNEPIDSIALMERASVAMTDWIQNNIPKNNRLFFLIGKGNNGGDGLAMARLLCLHGYLCSIFLAYEETFFTEETSINYYRLPKTITIQSLNGIQENDIIIDCLLGTGTQGLLKEPLSKIIRYINSLPNKIISIDIPSGMKCEWENNVQQIIHATITLTLEFPKLAMLLPEAGECCGEIHIIPIGLSKEYLYNTDTPYYFMTKKDVQSLFLPRKKFTYKNIYGHCLLISGSEVMPGASILATGGALKSGCGLVSIHTSQLIGYSIIHYYPSAMLSIDTKNHFSTLPQNIEKYTSIGIGCGLGKHPETIKAFETLLDTFQKPIVIDADALNIIAEKKSLLQKIPAGSILTPHLGELKRLIGKWYSEQEKIQLVLELSKTHHIIIIVKGMYSMAVYPNGKIYFNNTGNSGMAKAGSGDVLTGLIAGLIARGYDSINASLIGIYLHGLAGDKASIELSMEAMNSHDIITYLSQAFLEINNL